MRAMRVFSITILVVILFLSGCGGSPPTPTPVPTLEPPEAPALLALPALTDAPEQWSGRAMTLIAPLVRSADNRRLGIAVNESATAEVGNDARTTLWLAQPLPATITDRLKEGLNILKLRGRLSPPGAYGTDARYLYQFSVESAGILQPEQTTLTNLADNPRALNAILIEIEGTLLATTDGALMTTSVTAGGVPAPGARQIKLRNPPPPQLLARLHQSGGVRYGIVTILGWWQDSRLTPFTIETKP